MQNLLKNKSFLFSLLGIVVLIIGIFTALQLFPQNQDTRRDAASNSPTATAQIRIEPSTLSLSSGETKSVAVTFNSSTTGTVPNSINGIVAVIKYTYTGTAPQLTASNIQLQSPFSRTDSWNCANTGVRTNEASKEIRIEVACRTDASSAIFSTNNSFQPFFNFQLTGVSATSQAIILSFDETETSIARFLGAGEQGTSEILGSPISSRLTVNVRAAARLDMTLAASALTCTTNEFTATTELKQGTTAQPNVVVTFKYNNQTKTATSNAQGVASTTFTKAATNMDVSAEATNYPTRTATVTLPTNCGGSGGGGTGDTQPVKRILLSTDGLKCGDTSFTVNATVKEGNSNIQDVRVKFKYDNQEKTSATASNGQTSATFNKAGTDQWVNAEAEGYVHGSLEIKLPTNCSTTAGAACNAACTSSRDCASGRSCVNGVCRDSRCTSDATCRCSDTNPAGQTGDTQLPESGFDQTLAFTILGMLFILGGGQLFWSFRAKSDESAE